MNTAKPLAALVLAGATIAVAHAQTPPAGTAPAPGAPAQARTDSAPAAAQPLKRRSIVHHYPYPYPEYYHGDQYAGFRNPGGQGRYIEYYPPGDRFQTNGADPVRVARFDQGGGAPDRAEQLAAQQIGIARYNSIQQHIDNYARPYIGFGVGYFGGMY
jgi:hypothetical protein